MAGKSTIADKILKKLNKPKIKDIDIESQDFNAGNVSDNEDSNSDSDSEDRVAEERAKRQHYVKTDKSKIRDTTINLGDKYVGSKVDRSELFNMSENDDEEEEEEEEEGEEEEEEEEEEEGSDILADVTDSEAEEQLNSEEEDDNSSNSEEDMMQDDDVENASSSEDEDEQFKREKISQLIQQEKSQAIARATNTAKLDALKGYTILHQGAQFDKILDSRIKIQKALVNVNTLPINKETLDSLSTDKTSELIQEVNDKLLNLIEKLTQIRSETIKPLTKDHESVENALPKKRKLSALIESNSKLDQIETPIRKAVLSKWSNRVQSASGIGALSQSKFKVLNQSIWNQVNAELGDLDRLVKKTKINRRNITPLGYQEPQNEPVSDNEDMDEIDNQKVGLSNIDKSLETNDYIYDDDDFYRLLLNDMINKKLDQKQANSQAILMLSKNKMKKNYEKGNTKDKRIRYTVIDKLIQFEMPKRNKFNWDDDQIDELFAGLMGMKVQMAESDEENSENEDDEHQDIETFKESGVKLFG